MRKGRAHSVALSVMVILAMMCTAQSCDEKKVKKEFRKWNIKAGKMTVACNEAWDGFYEAKTDEITEAIIEEYGDDPNFTDEQAEAEFKLRTAKLNGHNDKFEMSMKIIANSLEAIEQSLDAADHIDRKLWKKTIKDILNALDNVTVILNEAAKEAEDEHFTAALNWIGVVVNGGQSIMAMIGVEDDPDDPKDD
jgi:molecular chaperone GrpE (heat shock protein)